MAELEISSTINLHSTSNGCVNCSYSGTDGHILGASGNFDAHFIKSLKESAGNEHGQVLPFGGKSLPHDDSLTISSELKSSLSLLNRNSQLGPSTPNEILNKQNLPLLKLSTDLTIDSYNDLLTEGIDVDLLASQLQQKGITTENNLNTQVIAELTELQNAFDTKIQENSDLDKIAIPVLDDLENISKNEFKLNDDIIATQFNNISSLSSSLANQVTKAEISSTINNLNLDKHFQSNTSINASDQSSRLANLQNLNENGSLAEKLQDSITKSLSDSGIFENITKHKSIDSERINYQLNLVKTEAGPQSTSLSSTVDSYANISTNSLSSRTLETPIPILVKQGASMELIQQNVDQSIAQNIKWLVNNKIQNAKINVYPESLGQVNIALNIEDANLKINFIAATHATKELIEAGISNLRSQFQESGINLQEVNVETQFSSQSESESQFSDLESKNYDHNNEVSNLATNDLGTTENTVRENSSTYLHLLDAYA